MHDQQLVRTITARKASTGLSFALAALFLMLVGFLPRDNATGHTEAVLFLTIAVASLGIATPGWNVNHLDIAPRYVVCEVGSRSS